MAKGPPFHSGPLATRRNGPVSSNVRRSGSGVLGAVVFASALAGCLAFCRRALRGCWARLSAGAFASCAVGLGCVDGAFAAAHDASRESGVGLASGALVGLFCPRSLGFCRAACLTWRSMGRAALWRFCSFLFK